jgi:hypothetical protein
VLFFSWSIFLDSRFIFFEFFFFWKKNSTVVFRMLKKKKSSSKKTPVSETVAVDDDEGVDVDPKASVKKSSSPDNAKTLTKKSSSSKIRAKKGKQGVAIDKKGSRIKVKAIPSAESSRKSGRRKGRNSGGAKKTAQKRRKKGKNDDDDSDDSDDDDDDEVVGSKEEEIEKALQLWSGLDTMDNVKRVSSEKKIEASVMRWFGEENAGSLDNLAVSAAALSGGGGRERRGSFLRWGSLQGTLTRKKGARLSSSGSTPGLLGTWGRRQGNKAAAGADSAQSSQSSSQSSSSSSAPRAQSAPSSVARNKKSPKRRNGDDGDNDGDNGDPNSGKDTSAAPATRAGKAGLRKKKGSTQAAPRPRADDSDSESVDGPASARREKELTEHDKAQRAKINRQRFQRTKSGMPMYDEIQDCLKRDDAELLKSFDLTRRQWRRFAMIVPDAVALNAIECLEFLVTARADTKTAVPLQSVAGVDQEKLKQLPPTTLRPIELAIVFDNMRATQLVAPNTDEKWFTPDLYLRVYRMRKYNALVGLFLADVEGSFPSLNMISMVFRERRNVSKRLLENGFAKTFAARYPGYSLFSPLCRTCDITPRLFTLIDKHTTLSVASLEPAELPADAIEGPGTNRPPDDDDDDDDDDDEDGVDGKESAAAKTDVDKGADEADATKPGWLIEQERREREAAEALNASAAASSGDGSMRGSSTCSTPRGGVPVDRGLSQPLALVTRPSDVHVPAERRLEAMRVLLERGADPNHRNTRDGRTALFAAAAPLPYLRRRRVDLLLQFGADADIADRDGLRAQDIADVVTGAWLAGLRFPSRRFYGSVPPLAHICMNSLRRHYVSLDDRAADALLDSPKLTDVLIWQLFKPPMETYRWLDFVGAGVTRDRLAALVYRRLSVWDQHVTFGGAVGANGEPQQQLFRFETFARFRGARLTGQLHIVLVVNGHDDEDDGATRLSIQYGAMSHELLAPANEHRLRQIIGALGFSKPDDAPTFITLCLCALPSVLRAAGSGRRDANKFFSLFRRIVLPLADTAPHLGVERTPDWLLDALQSGDEPKQCAATAYHLPEIARQNTDILLTESETYNSHVSKLHFVEPSWSSREDRSNGNYTDDDSFYSESDSD